jgi:hypothetical protein
LIVSLPETAAAQLVAQLPTLAPRVVAWAQRMESESVHEGVPLTPALQRLARDVGVRDIARVRVVAVDRVPLPDEAPLRAAAVQVGLSQESASGITLGYAIYARRGEEGDVRLLSHELRHVAQYEAAGGIPAFLLRHLEDLARFGYEDSPFEVDARAHERRSLAGPGA